MIYCCEHHDELLTLWRDSGLREIALAHVDFHDDLRGLLVDRRRGVAYPTGALARGGAEPDPGDFLAHAVLEGRVRRLRWVHGTPGGRAWDSGIVRYETDLLALPRRIRHRLTGGREIPLDFEELLVEDWGGVEADERLSIDWDCFASILQDADGIGKRVEAFLARLGETVPADTYVSYSPEYSRPSLETFREFVEGLATRLGQGLRWLSPGLERGELHPTDVCAGLPSGALMRFVLFLRRRGIY